MVRYLARRRRAFYQPFLCDVLAAPSAVHEGRFAGEQCSTWLHHDVFFRRRSIGPDAGGNAGRPDRGPSGSLRWFGHIVGCRLPGWIYGVLLGSRGLVCFCGVRKQRLSPLRLCDFVVIGR